MLLYRFKLVRKLPNRNEDLLTIILPSAIRKANKEVAMAVKATEGRKRKLYKKISGSLRAQIALENGNVAAVRRFTKEFDTSLSESMVLKKSYISA